MNLALIIKIEITTGYCFNKEPKKENENEIKEVNAKSN